MYRSTRHAIAVAAALLGLGLSGCGAAEPPTQPEAAAFEDVPGASISTSVATTDSTSLEPGLGDATTTGSGPTAAGG